MCRLIVGIGSVNMNTLIDAAIAMAKDETKDHELNKKQGKGSWKHSDGWGIAYIESGQWKVHKTTDAIYNDPNIETFRNINPTVVMLHMRKKMGSNTSIRNTHPFQHNEFVFSHNGYIQEEITFHKRFKPKGKTDSEQLFYSILTNLAKDASPHTIRKTLLQYEKLSGTNIALSNKKKTFISTRENRYPSYYQMALLQKKDHIIISSEAFQDKNQWQMIDPGHTITIDHETLTLVIHQPEKIIPPQILSLPEYV